MYEFLKEYYVPLMLSVETLSVLTGLFCLKKYKQTATKYFVYFLVYVVFIEVVGRYTHYSWLSGFRGAINNTVFEKNFWWYTIFWEIGATLFFAWYYRTILKTKVYKTTVQFASICFLAIAVSYYAFHFQELFTKSTVDVVVLSATAVVVLCTVLYFMEILQSNKVVMFYRSVNFYISAALFVWYLVITPFTFFDMYYTESDWAYVLMQWKIYLLANLFMYLTFAVALLVSKPKYD